MFERASVSDVVDDSPVVVHASGESDGDFDARRVRGAHVTLGGGGRDGDGRLRSGDA